MKKKTRHDITEQVRVRHDIAEQVRVLGADSLLPKARRTAEEIMAELGRDTPLNRARKVFSSCAAHVEQMRLQLKPLTPIELRRLEFEAVEKIVKAYGEQT